jgi:LysR family hydrogen peroxide-inducible transcriptional activator
MTLQELRFLVALADTQHFGKAAESCFVSQPTLSIAIRKLESELGITLFERHKNNVHLTPVGADIIASAKKIFTETDYIKQLAKADPDDLTRVFKLGVIYTIGPYLLPTLITGLSQVAPSLPLEIHEDFTANLRVKLKEGSLDAIIISLPFSESNTATATLYREDFVVLLPKLHPLAQYQTIESALLAQYNILMLGEGHCFRDQILASCPMCFIKDANADGEGVKTIIGSSLETIRHMVAANMGITILPATAAMGPYTDSLLTTRPLVEKSPQREVVLVWRKNYPRHNAINALIEAVAKSGLPK